LRITVLTAVTSLWWVAGLALQGTHGIPILRYTETYETVASAAFAPDLLRGLGYWFFYGQDGLGAWTASSVTMIQAPFALALSYLLPGLGFVGVLLTRWRNRAFFAVIVVVGLVISIGSHPWDSPSPYGAIFKAWSRSDMGLSFRSTPRAVPLIALGMSVFLGAGIAALTRWRPRLHRPLAAALLILICLNQIALFRGQMVDRNLLRDENLPDYRVDAAEALSDGDRSTRVMEIPGIDFAAYRWGNTVDPVTPGMTDREYVARELIPYGSPPSADLLNDVDSPFQAGRSDPSTLAPLSRLMGVGDIMFRADLQFERYLTPRPRVTWRQLLNAPGLGEPITFGAPVPNEASENLPTDDTQNFGVPVGDADPPPVSIFPVEDPRAILRSVSATDPVIVAGNGSGLVALAASGALQADRPNFYSASFGDNQAELAKLLKASGTSLVVTDTNRRQGRRWGSVRENEGYTERAGEKPLLVDPTDNRLDVFPGSGDDSKTVVEQVGGATIAASRYGNGVTFTPGDRAVNAMDGNPETAWRVAAFEKAEGNFLEIDLREPVTTDHLTLLQGQGFKNRWMTGISLSFDGGAPVPVGLDDSSRTSPGQVLNFPKRKFSKLRITIESTDLGPMASYRGISDVGIAEVTIPGVEPVHEIVRPPVDLLDAAGADSISRPLSYIFTRRANNQRDILAADEEPALARWVIGPIKRTFTPFGKGRVAVDRSDTQIDATLGLDDVTRGGITANSSNRLPGTIASRARSAVDGDLSTAYQTPIGDPLQSLEFKYPTPVTVDSLKMELFADGKHSLPTKVTVSVDGVEGEPIDLPQIDRGVGRKRGATTSVEVPTGKLSGRTFTVRIDTVDEVASKDWFAASRIVLPVGIAEVGLPPEELPPANTPLPAACRSDLVTIGDKAVPLRMVGTIGAATAGDIVDFASCGDPVDIESGRTLLKSASGASTGIDVDLLTLSSAAGGAAGVDTISNPPSEGPTPPRTTTERTGRISYDVNIQDADEPYWVVLGQSYGSGWKATTSDGVDLGESTLVNGYANGWRIDPTTAGADVTVHITWAPQRIVWMGLGASAVGVIICLVLALRPTGRKRASNGDASPEALPADTQAVAHKPATGPVQEPESESISAPDLMTATESISEPEPMPDQESIAVPGSVIEPTVPIGVSPFAVDGPTLSLAGAALATIVSGLFGLFFGGWAIGLVVALAALVMARVNRGQGLVRFACVALYGAAVAYIVLKEWINKY
ncbi:MAG TPA: alpha-(1-_3)-arabinofuranosyltransferase family protein, partial [Microthrixaceae bacterium]|nr:alpha-(1->3)-arabinofuranosyltransferase family protein [Microthrixaceae bacterium]